VRLYKAGLSQSAVAAVVGIPITSIKAALVEAGVEIRGRHPGASLSVKAAMARVMAMEARETAEALRLSDMVDYHMGNKRRAA
jgi:stringent starvation protein B